jgi:hypothetical protein
VCMNDIFEVDQNYWYHKGRHDLIRINDTEMDLGYIMQLPEKYSIDATCVNDNIFNKIYLAIWSPMPPAATKIKVELLTKDLNRKYNDRIKIDNYQVLNKNDFMRGIKLDHELVREWFRNNLT